MDNPNYLKSLKNNYFFLAALWTLCIVSACYFTFLREKKHTINLAVESATFFNNMAKKIIKWSSLNKGVYISSKNNKQKKFIFKDIFQVLREVSEIDNSQNIVIRLTSLNPVDIKNSPDNWERNGLKIIEKTRKPYYGFSKINGNVQVFRYLSPLFVTKDCTNCHSKLSLKLGQLRGAISIIFPASKFLETEKTSINHSIYFFVLIWIIGISALIFLYRDNYRLLIKIDELSNRFKIIFENSHLPMFILENNLFVDCNRAAVKLFKAKSKEDIINHHPADISPDFQEQGIKSFEKANEMLAKGIKEGFVNFEWFHKDFNNQIIYTLVTLSLFVENNRNFIFALVQDISHLKDFERKLNATLNTINEAVVVVDNRCIITIFNPVAEKLTGIKKENALNKDFYEVFNLYDLETGKKIETRYTNIHKKVRLTSINRENFIVEVFVSPLFEMDRQVGTVVIIRDVTEKEQMEKELAKIKTLEKIGRLAAGIAHEFNNLLTVIYGNVSLLKLKSVDIVTRKYIEKIENTLKPAMELTGKLLTFSKGGEPLRESVFLKDIFEEIKIIFKDKDNIELVSNIAPDLYCVNIDKKQFFLCLKNIIINSIEAMPNGGSIYINVSNFDVDEKHEILKKGSYVKIEIIDTGVGIPEKVLDKIFDPFFTTKESATGLGLSIAYSIIEKHGGLITVESSENRGTTITIYLPATDNFDETSSLSKKGNIKVLFMDDNDTVREIAKEIFQSLNCSVDLCINGDEAIEFARKNRYDLIILDFTIEYGRGAKEIIGEIKKENIEAKFVVVSGYPIEKIFPDYRNLGFDYFLMKPFTLIDIKNMLKKI